MCFNSSTPKNTTTPAPAAAPPERTPEAPQIGGDDRIGVGRASLKKKTRGTGALRIDLASGSTFGDKTGLNAT